MENSYQTLRQIAESAVSSADIVAQYIDSNDSKLVPKISALIDSVPEYKAINDELRASATTLYRGIALLEALPDDEILAYEQKQKFVATSRSEQVAKDYAKGKDVINGKNETTPKRGVVITYEVVATDVIFDLATFDKEHGTLETLINPQTATMVKMEDVIIDDDTKISKRNT